MLDRFPDLSLVEYGFVYHRDPFPQDDLTWFLLEKPQAAVTDGAGAAGTTRGGTQ
jgi:hypothetical protein